MQKYATHAQRKEIRRLGGIAFKGDIDSEAFLEFSPWLQKQHGYTYVDKISFEVAGKVIESLRELAGITNHPQHGVSIEKAAQMYLKGIEAGQTYPTRNAPPLEKVIAKLKEEMNE